MLSQQSLETSAVNAGRAVPESKCGLQGNFEVGFCFLLGSLEVQDAINADDEGALLKALSDVEGSPATADLSTPERQIMHLRQAAAGPGCRSEAKVRLTVALFLLDFGLDLGAPRIPAMRARAEMRKELSSAIRKSEPWFAGTSLSCLDSGNRSLQGLLYSLEPRSKDCGPSVPRSSRRRPLHSST